jgi:hypothetical protein
MSETPFMGETGRRSIVDWLFRSRATGDVVIAQAPNPPLFVFLGATVAGWIAPVDSTVHDVLAWVAAGGLAWWALDEVVRGVNPWRRLLGVFGCGLVVARVLDLIS